MAIAISIAARPPADGLYVDQFSFFKGHLTAVFADLAIKKVHGGHADETGHEPIDGMIIGPQRRIGLLNFSFFHDHDAIPKGHGLFLIVRNVNGGCFETMMEAF